MYSSNGLGFPFIPIAMAVGSVIGGKLFKKKPKVKREDAERAVQQIYLELLERDPFNPRDPGADGYVNCLLEGWCDADFIRTEVLSSQERKDLQMRKAQEVFGPPTTRSAALLPAGVVPPELEGILPFALGGVVLFFLLRR